MKVYILIYGIVSYNFFFKKLLYKRERGKLKSILVVEFVLKILK